MTHDLNESNLTQSVYNIVQDTFQVSQQCGGPWKTFRQDPATILPTAGMHTHESKGHMKKPLEEGKTLSVSFECIFIGLT